MKPIAIALTAFVISATGASGAFARPMDAAVRDVAQISPNAAQCEAQPASKDPWTKADLAHLLTYLRVPYDSISSAPGACMTVAIRGHNGMLDEDIFNPASLTQIL